MIKMLGPDDVWQPKLGAPIGNRNALKHGREDRKARDLRRRIVAWKRRAKAAVKHARALARHNKEEAEK